VDLVGSDVSEELGASIIKVTRFGSSQKTAFFIVTSVKTSDLTILIIFSLLNLFMSFH
jgi:hypothetical protein